MSRVTVGKELMRKPGSGLLRRILTTARATGTELGFETSGSIQGCGIQTTISFSVSMVLPDTAPLVRSLFNSGWTSLKVGVYQVHPAMVERGPALLMALLPTGFMLHLHGSGRDTAGPKFPNSEKP